MSGINNGNRSGWGQINWRFWQKPKISPDSPKDELDQKVNEIVTARSLKADSLEESIPKVVKHKTTLTTSAQNDKVHLCAIPCILPDYFEETSSETDSQNIEFPLMETLNQKLTHYKEPSLKLNSGETIEQTLTTLKKEVEELKTTQESSHVEELQEKSSKLAISLQKIAVLEGLLNVQKEIESSKKDLDDELFSFVIDYNQIEKNIGLINEWAIKKAPIENFVDNLKNTLFTRVQYKRQELFENCNSLKEKNEKSLRWINDTIKGLSKEGNSAFKNVYLKFLTSQKALLEEQSSKLNIISNKLISPKDLHISQEEFDSEKANIDPLWQKFHLTLYSLNEDSKETIRRNMYSFNASTETKELCKKLLIQGKPLKKLTEAQMASAVSLIQDMQNSRLFKHDYKIAIY